MNLFSVVCTNNMIDLLLPCVYISSNNSVKPCSVVKADQVPFVELFVIFTCPVDQCIK